MKPLGLYIHIPFCVKKCSYCDFYSVRYTTDTLVNRYISAVCNHIKKEAHLYKDYVFDTVFIGGGTPSLINPLDFQLLMKSVMEGLNISCDAEITLEANPGTLTKEKLITYYDSGVNRLSIGLQSTNDIELMRLGRIHTLKDFKENYTLAREVGFNNISIDVMYGLPEQKTEDFLKTLDQVCDFEPEHISSYCLKIEEGTAFGAIKDSLAIPSDDEEYNMYISMCQMLEKRGWGQYEISNFAKKGYRSKHNLKYWLCKEYIGFGPASHSFFDGVRYSYDRDIEGYIKGVQGNSLIKLIEEDSMSDIEKMDEYVMLRLRLSDGIDISDFSKKFGKLPHECYPRIEKYIKSGHVMAENGKIAFNPKGFFVSNYILADILNL